MPKDLRSIVLPALLSALAFGGSLAEATAAPLSLLGDRFRVEATWRTADGHTGVGTPVSLTTETGYFWFFAPGNVEVVVKALDACASPSQRFWFFGTGLTDAQVTLTVTDETTGEQKTYTNPLGRAFLPIQDTGAFSSCGTTRCGQGAFEDIAATPRADTNLEALALAMGGGLTADPGVYARVVADVASLRAHIDLAGIDFAPYFDRQVLVLTLDLSVIQAARNGTYHAWDCLNHWYGVTAAQTSASSTSVLLTFSKVLDTQRLVADYRAVPGVGDALVLTRNVFPIFPTPTIPSLCGRIEGTTHHYYGRVPGIATFYYTSTPGAAPHFVGEDRGGTPPSWAADARECFSRLVDGVGI